MDFELNVRYVENSLKIDSPEMKQICEAAAENQINVSLGFSERDGESVYIAQALIDDTGKLRMTRRKMKPTHMERTVFGDASGSCLAKVVDVPDVGKIGGLSCWEHIQPLLKYYTFSQGEQIHVAAWPPLDGFIQGSPGFYSMSIEGEQVITMTNMYLGLIHAGCLNQSQSYAIESQAFVLHCTSALTEAGIEAMKTAGSPIMGSPIAGSSAIVGPDGRVLSAPEASSEKLIVADLDLSLVTKTKTFADASGHCVSNFCSLE